IALNVTENYAYDVMMPIVNELNFPGTSTNYYFRAITEKSIHSLSQPPYQRDLGGVFPFTQFIPNKNIELTSPRLVASLVNETNLINMGSSFANKSLVWEIDLQSTLDNLSPMVDMSRCSAVLINNRIDYRTDVNTPATVPTAAAPPYVAEGILSANWLGTWSITTPYSINNTVIYKGLLYTSRIAGVGTNTGNQPDIS